MRMGHDTQNGGRSRPGAHRGGPNTDDSEAERHGHDPLSVRHLWMTIESTLYPICVVRYSGIDFEEPAEWPVIFNQLTFLRAVPKSHGAKNRSKYSRSNRFALYRTFKNDDSLKFERRTHDSHGYRNAQQNKLSYF